MSNFTPQQEAAITTIDRNVAVSAGAGSGKTRVLVERFLHILRHGLQTGKPISAGEILAITFTRKAAGEMKERLYTSMQELLTQESEHEAFWKEQLAELERAQITTIHGFCNRVLKENPVETELDPSFMVADEFENDEYLQNCLRDYVRQALQKQDEAVQVLTDAYGVQGLLAQMETLTPVLEDVLEFGDLRAPYEAFLKTEPAGKARLCSLIEEFVNRRKELGKTQQAGRAELLAENLHEVLQGIMAEPTDFAAYNIYVDKMRNTGKLKDLLVEIKDTQAKLATLEVDKAALPLVTAWQEVLRNFAAFYYARKEQEDFLVFDDLETRALALLRNNLQVRKKYQNKYRHVMIDEFQDTNDKQKELAYLLCGDDVNVLQGKKLFVVGDPKQSIYRFRGADVSVFAAVRADIKASGGVDITLPDNFRTVDKILEACNEVFAKLLGEDDKQDVFFEPLQPHRTSDVKPVFMQVPYDNETKPLARKLEAAAVAKNISERYAAGEPYGEMAILLSAMTECKTVTEALQERKIPFQVIDGKGFYEQQEVKDILHLLTVLHNRRRSLELAGVLRSPYFGLTDESITKLFLLAQEKNICLWDALMACDISAFEQAEKIFLKNAQQVLQGLRKSATVLALPELLEKVRYTLAVEMVASMQDNGAAKLANVKKLFRLGMEYSVNKLGTLASWLEHVQNMRNLEARETAANLNAADAVTIMTIHKSKGLEFSTVYLPMLDRSGASDTSVVKFDKRLGLGVKAVLADGSSDKSSVLSKIKEIDSKLEKEERQRQFYVAMTRAKNNLVMSGAFNESTKSRADNWFNSLAQIFAASEVVDFLVEDMRGAEVVFEKPPRDDFALSEATLPDEDAISPLPNFAASGQKAFTATALQTYLHCQRQYFYQREGLPQVEEAVEAGSNVLPPHIIGLIVHKALELYNGKNLEEVFRLAVEEFADGNFAGAERAWQMLEDYVASDIFVSGDKLKELRFAVPIGDLFISGVVDCLVKNEDGSCKIVDYKTGRELQTGKVNLGYAYQLALYKHAVEKLLQVKVSGADLHFLQNLSVWHLPQDKDYLAEAVALCEEISSKGKEQDFTCTLAVCKHCPYNYLCPQK